VQAFNDQFQRAAFAPQLEAVEVACFAVFRRARKRQGGDQKQGVNFPHSALKHGRRRKLRLSDFPSMAHPHDEDPQNPILDGRHDAIVAHAILPEASKAGAPVGLRRCRADRPAGQRGRSGRRECAASPADRACRELAPRGGIQAQRSMP